MTDLPIALTHASEIDLSSFDAQDRAVMERLKKLRLQRCALSLALVFEAFPALSCVRLFRANNLSIVDNRYDEPLFALSNRGPCDRFIHSHFPIENYLRPVHSGLIVRIDPDALKLPQPPEDAALATALAQWIKTSHPDALAAVRAIRFDRPPLNGEPIAIALIRKVLDPAEFSVWQAAYLSDHTPKAAPGPSRAAL